MKWFKDGAVYESASFDKDLEVVAKAQEIIEAFNDMGRIDQNVCLNIPEVAEFVSEGEKSCARWDAQNVLVEPFISRYRRFNSNTGYVVGSDPWSKVTPKNRKFCLACFANPSLGQGNI